MKKINTKNFLESNMKSAKKFWSEFKKFISRGNVIDLAVGVIIGSAFTAIVTALTNKIIMPLINWLLLLIFGGNGLDSIYTFLKKAYVVDEFGITTNTVDLANSIYIDWGAFLTAILNFILIALVLFTIVKIINKAYDLTKEVNEKVITLSKKQIKKLKKQGLSDEEIQKVQETQQTSVQATTPEVPPKPTTEELLSNILTELKKQNDKSLENKIVEDK